MRKSVNFTQKCGASVAWARGGGKRGERRGTKHAIYRRIPGTYALLPRISQRFHAKKEFLRKETLSTSAVRVKINYLNIYTKSPAVKTPSTLIQKAKHHRSGHINDPPLRHNPGSTDMPRHTAGIATAQEMLRFAEKSAVSHSPSCGRPCSRAALSRRVPAEPNRTAPRSSAGGEINTVTGRGRRWQNVTAMTRRAGRRQRQRFRAVTNGANKTKNGQWQQQKQQQQH